MKLYSAIHTLNIMCIIDNLFKIHVTFIKKTVLERRISDTREDYL